MSILFHCRVVFLPIPNMFHVSLRLKDLSAVAAPAGRRAKGTEGAQAGVETTSTTSTPSSSGSPTPSTGAVKLHCM